MTRLNHQPWMTSTRTQRLFDALESHGGEDCARFVGGCVRNSLMGLEAADIDIATKLTPDRTLAALADAGIRAVATGIEHGTVTAILDGEPYEVTSLRRDVETDGRRAVVAFTEDWAEDAQRRDFRLNALYADREGQVFDPTGGGVEDAAAGRIVFVGDAEMRLREDYLRILRFFRFYAWYGQGEPDGPGLRACEDLREGVRSLSAERVSKELLKLMAAEDPAPSVRLMASTGILELILPDGLQFERFDTMIAIDPDPVLRLSALLPDDPVVIGATADRLRLSNAERERLLDALASPPPVDLTMDARAARAAIYQLGSGVFCDRVRRAWATTPDQGELAVRLLDFQEHWTPPPFPIRGEDVVSAGVPVGPRVGMLLRELETWWIAQDFPRDGVDARLKTLAQGAR